MPHFTKKNCSPNVHGKTVKRQSCLTEDLLVNMKKKYNKKKRGKDRIKHKEPQKIWDEFRIKMKNCNDEQCWISNLYQQEMRERLHEFIFSPNKPYSWAKNPNEWLSNFDIEAVMHQYEESDPTFKFIGTTFIDWESDDSVYGCVEPELCKFNLEKEISDKKTKIAVIFNLDKHTGSGTHWTSMFIDIRDKFIFYFDSNGTKTPKQMLSLVNKIKEQGKNLGINFTFYENHPFTHQYSNSECGMYSLFFIITLLTNKVNDKPFKTVKDKVNLFKRKRIPDKHVELLRNVYFN